jgi:hypothetical protein
VRYAELRRRPPDRVVWYEGIDAATARREVLSVLAAVEHDDPVTLAAAVAARVLAAFGIAADAGVGPALTVRVRPDPLFGPLLEVSLPGAPAVERITPLTAADVAEVLEAIGAPRGGALAEAIGRISQLIEELPWVWSLECALAAGTAAVAARPSVVTVRRVTSGQASRP